MRRTASFSADRRYRYRLGRRWGRTVIAFPGHAGRGGVQADRDDVVTWVMLNPSTADASADDPTIRRVIGLSSAWGHQGCEVVNLFALRSTAPAGLRDALDPVGPHNRTAVRATLDRVPPGGVVVAAWGAGVPGVPMADESAWLLGEVRRRGLRPVAVGRNADGSPRHPLYVSRHTRYSDLE